jgi:hypothetical protein
MNDNFYVKTCGENFIILEMFFSKIPYVDHMKPEFSEKRSAQNLPYLIVIGFVASKRPRYSRTSFNIKV